VSAEKECPWLSSAEIVAPLIGESPEDDVTCPSKVSNPLRTRHSLLSTKVAMGALTKFVKYDR